jgi:hypothetical protein
MTNQKQHHFRKNMMNSYDCIKLTTKMDKSITIQDFHIVCPRLKPWAMVRAIFHQTPVGRLHNIVTNISNMINIQSINNIEHFEPRRIKRYFFLWCSKGEVSIQVD